MSIAENLAIIAENVPKVYNAGYEKGKAESGGGVDNTMLDSIIQRTTTHVESQTATSVGANVFSGYGLLQSADFPMAQFVSQYAFKHDTNLNFVNLPKVKTLEMECFYNCVKLPNIDLPNVTSIARGVFSSAGLKTLIIRTPQVCSLANVTGISGTPIAKGEGFIYVPDELVDDYKSATNWSTYAEQIKGISELGVSE
jgi:hypothetical protein